MISIEKSNRNLQQCLKSFTREFVFGSWISQLFVSQKSAVQTLHDSVEDSPFHQSRPLHLDPCPELARPFLTDEASPAAPIRCSFEPYVASSTANRRPPRSPRWTLSLPPRPHWVQRNRPSPDTDTDSVQLSRSLCGRRFVDTSPTGWSTTELDHLPEPDRWAAFAEPRLVMRTNQTQNGAIELQRIRWRPTRAHEQSVQMIS